jgi:hypothetical protein
MSTRMQRRHRYRGRVITAVVTATILCAPTCLSTALIDAATAVAPKPAPAVSANSPTDKAYPSRAFLQVPRSPGVFGVTSPAAIHRACQPYSFADIKQFREPTAFSGGTLSGGGQVLVVGRSWGTWKPQANGLHVLFADSGISRISLTSPVRGVGVKAQPNDFGSHPITVTAYDPRGRSLGSFRKTINGDSGAEFIGLVAASRPIKRFVISAPPAASGFAYTRLTWGPSNCN